MQGGESVARGVAVFDFDGTIIKGDSVVRLLRRAYEKGYLSLGELLRACARGVLYALRLLDETRSKAPAHDFLARLNAGEREAFLRAFARELAQSARPEALSAIRTAKEQGDIVLLCSASCHCYMRFVARELGADALLCTPSAPDGRMAGANCKGEEKVRRVRAWLDERALDAGALAVGYGDSAGDRFILSLCARPVLVNAKRALKKRMPRAERVRWREK